MIPRPKLPSFLKRSHQDRSQDLKARLSLDAKALGADTEIGWDPDRELWWVLYPSFGAHPLLFLIPLDYPYSAPMALAPKRAGWCDSLGCSGLPESPMPGWEQLPLIAEAWQPGDDLQRASLMARLLLFGRSPSQKG